MKKELKSINELRDYLRLEKYRYEGAYLHYSNLSETIKTQELKDIAYKMNRHIICIEAIMDKTMELCNINDIYDYLVNEYKCYNDIVIYYNEESKKDIPQELKNKYIELMDYFIINVNTARDTLNFIKG